MKLVLLLVILTLLTTGPAGAQTTGATTLNDEQIRECYTTSYRYEKTQNYDDAIKAMAPVYHAYPTTYTVNLRLGWLYYLKGLYANAEANYQAAIKAAPSSIEAKIGVLLPLLAQQRYSDVETLAGQVLRVDPCNYYANLRLAYVLRLQKKFDLADEVCNRMLPLYPSDVSYLSEKGLVKWAQNDIAGATPYFAQVQVLDPENLLAKTYFTPVGKTAAKPVATTPTTGAGNKPLTGGGK